MVVLEVSRDEMAKWDLLTAKCLFFCNAMSSVGWSRFQNNFYLNQGLSAAEIGTLKSIGLLLKFVGEPLWCVIADTTSIQVVFGMCMFMQILTMELMRTTIPLTYDTLLLIKVLRTSTAPSSTLTTTTSYQLTQGTNEGYGKQRMYGSLAWGTGASIVGLLIDLYGMQALFFYTYFFNFINFFMICVGLRYNGKDRAIKSIGTSEGEVKSVNVSGQSLRAALKSTFNSIIVYTTTLRQFLAHNSCRVVIINALVYGIVMTVPDTFLFISVEKDLGASRSFTGILTTTSILACLPLFYHSDALIAKYGHFKMILVSQQLCVLRLLMYALIPSNLGKKMSLGLILIISLIHGVNFALFWSAVVDTMYILSGNITEYHLVNCSPSLLFTDYCGSTRSGGDLKASFMAALNLSFFTLGGAVGNALWGYLYTLFGGIFYVYILGAVVLFANTRYFEMHKVS